MRGGAGLRVWLRSVWSAVQWEQFMKLGEDMDNSVIEEKIKAQKPEQCALLIYTVSIELFVS